MANKPGTKKPSLKPEKPKASPKSGGGANKKVANKPDLPDDDLDLGDKPRQGIVRS